jgi:hypothetical protein
MDHLGVPSAHAIPTVYKGVQMRSRLEARWAAFFDELGWPWEYEPVDLAGSGGSASIVSTSGAGMMLDSLNVASADASRFITRVGSSPAELVAATTAPIT